MSQTLQIINIIVLVAAMWFALYSLSKSDRARKKKQAQDEEEMQRWEKGAEIASQDKDYMAFVHDFTGLGPNYDPTIPHENINLQGKPYDRDEWRYTMPDSAIKHLEECFEGDGHKVNAMKRAIELSIEHYTYEMEDDTQCVRIIEERVFRNPKPSEIFDIEEYKQYREERDEKEKAGDAT
ncbi:MAG: hypothetical protein Q8R86_09395 [Sulfuricurvum sp.]|nr:hypothetical protein [Sulfuricurvum sp.]